MPSDADRQREYYSATAAQYNDWHVNAHEQDEHSFTLAFMTSILDYYGIHSVLDVGAGTGRTLQYLKKMRPDIRTLGIEPVAELRDVGYANGLSRESLVEGDALRLPFRDGEFDLVCEFGVLHHIRTPDIAVAEMLRVAKTAIYISDANNFGQGSFLVRSLKQLINAVGLWKAADLVRTRGKGYTLSEGDGLAYSYSVFNNYKQIQERCAMVHVLNSAGAGTNPYRSASHVALLGVKK
jgi:SAM-dependent methyltransferase